ncbi:hypothetical protein AVEN_136352-1 [Araneus ventricosus]|uniref:Uncharacterized protein n=1 Tax=Araneus ventricosus TaxID=182803 RepID=A0A4Y2E1T2_ARAVE|nr:hypothetical protein AVEN_136352-1 [Araneus ventricosus]
MDGLANLFVDPLRRARRCTNDKPITSENSLFGVLYTWTVHNNCSKFLPFTVTHTLKLAHGLANTFDNSVELKGANDKPITRVNSLFGDILHSYCTHQFLIVPTIHSYVSFRGDAWIGEPFRGHLQQRRRFFYQHIVPHEAMPALKDRYLCR